MIKGLQERSFVITFFILMTVVYSETLDNAFDLEITEGNEEFGKLNTEEIMDLNDLQTEDWKDAPKFLNFCSKNNIREANQIHR